jgi:hypothetical protein
MDGPTIHGSTSMVNEPGNKPGEASGAAGGSKTSRKEVSPFSDLTVRDMAVGAQNTPASRTHTGKTWEGRRRAARCQPSSCKVKTGLRTSENATTSIWSDMWKVDTVGEGSDDALDEKGSRSLHTSLTVLSPLSSTLPASTILSSRLLTDAVYITTSWPARGIKSPSSKLDSSHVKANQSRLFTQGQYVGDPKQGLYDRRALANLGDILWLICLHPSTRNPSHSAFR